MMRNREDEVGALLFWQYLASLVSLPVCIAAFLLMAARVCRVAGGQ
jgi:hypothetical protein